MNSSGKYLIVASLWAVLGWTGSIKGSEEAWILYFESLPPGSVLHWCTHSIHPDWCQNYYYYYQVYQHQFPNYTDEE